jgi:hypothetical protein
VRYRFFADPVYGGNRDMAAWKMIGFPSVQYEYSGWVERTKSVIRIRRSTLPMAIHGPRHDRSSGNEE